MGIADTAPILVRSKLSMTHFMNHTIMLHRQSCNTVTKLLQNIHAKIVSGNNVASCMVGLRAKLVVARKRTFKGKAMARQL